MIPAGQPNFKTHFTQLLRQTLSEMLPEGREADVEVARPKQASHGDYSCNIAMQLAKPLRRSPRDIANLLAEALSASPYLEKVEIAGGGFINLFLRLSAKQQIPHHVLSSGEGYGRSNVGASRKIQVEFVSATPTGPLHVGHGRGAAFGASLANVLEAAGYSVTREYYVNDAGRQMDMLALSTWLRYLELNKTATPFPGNAYQGEYVRDMARLIHKAHAERYVHRPELLFEGLAPEADGEARLDGLIVNAKKLLGQDYAYIHNFVLTEQLGDCRNDLMEFRAVFDVWFSEQSLFDSGSVSRVVDLLERSNYVYQQDGAKWFKSTDFGDEKDRVIQRENGQFTYCAADIAYPLNKFERGFERVIDVWGADHHGYIPRVKGAMRALSL